MKKTLLYGITLLALIIASCNRGPKPKPKFEGVVNVKYTEVKRRFSDGLVFNETGYQLEPLWRMWFISNDSVRIYSQERGKFYNFKVYYDHDSVINMADNWLKIKKITPDSLLFQVLFVKNKEILDEESNIYMTFYSDKLVSKIPDTKIMYMGLPSARDTAFIKNLVAKISKDSTKFFAGREAPKIESRSPDLQVETQQYVKSFLTAADPADPYMHPEFHITMHKAYDNFYYRFSAYIEADGTLRFKEPLQLITDFREHIIGAMKGIVNGYLRYYTKVTPGSTLGIKHRTSVIIEIKGVKK